MTKFEQALQQVKEGKLATPSVSYGGKDIDYIGYQLSVHIFNMKILASGMSMRNVKLKDLKDYYGLKGKTAKDCLPQLETIYNNYKATL